MAFRSLTESFVFMRNNAIQSRHLFHSERSHDRERLVSRERSRDVEKSLVGDVHNEWLGVVNSIQYTFDMIREKIKELIALHDRHLMASNLDDNLDEDKEIETQTRELTELFNLSHGQLSRLSKLKHATVQQPSQASKLSENVLSNLARTLQELSSTLRRAQSEYLNKLRSRNERIRSYLAVDLNFGDATKTDLLGYGADDSDQTMVQIEKQKSHYLLDENTNMVAEREKGINEIVHSIYELNQIFQDVAQMVVNQGTLVDRIDYNMEHTQIYVQEGLKQLTKAKTYQTKDRKMIIIMALAIAIVIFGLLLIFTKF